MSFKQFPVQFKGYHNGDAGLIYPNSPSMLNCRLNHHDAVEQTKGYGIFPDLSLSATYPDTVLSSSVNKILSVWNFTKIAQNATISQPTFVSTPLILGRTTGATLKVYAYDVAGLRWLSCAALSSTGRTADATDAIRALSYLNYSIITRLPDASNPSNYSFYALSSALQSPLLGVDGITYSAPAAPHYAEVHYNRLFLANVYGYASRVQWSDPLSIWSWPGTNYVDINTDDGDKITGIKSYKGDLYVFKHYSVYKIVGSTFDPVTGNYSVIKLEGIPGSICQEGICTANGNLYWVSQQFIIEFNGSSFEFIDYPYLIDDRASMTWSEEAPYRGYAPFLLQHNEKQHEIIFSKRGTAVFYVFDYLQRQWAKLDISSTSMNIWAFCEYTDQTTGAKDLMFGSDSGKTYLFGDYRTFAGAVGAASAINCYYETDWMDMGTWVRKEASRVILDTKQDGFLSAHPYSLSCSIYYDYDTVARSSQVIQCDGATNQFHDIYPDVQTFRRIKLRFANNTLDNSMQVNRAVIEYDLIDESGRI